MFNCQCYVAKKPPTVHYIFELRIQALRSHQMSTCIFELGFQALKNLLEKPIINNSQSIPLKKCTEKKIKITTK